MRIAIASSGLGHVNRGIEAWAADLGAALHARGENVKLYKGAGIATLPFERVLPCWQRDAPATLRLLRNLPISIAWRLGLGSGYGIEQTTFAWKLIGELRQEYTDILHVQDPQVALIAQRAHRLGIIPTRTILAHGTEESADFLKKFDFIQHLAPWHLERMREAGAWKPAWTAIPNFIDTQIYHPGRCDLLRTELGIPKDALVVLTAAAIKRGHKRIDYLLTEFSRLLENHPELPVWLIVAGGWETETDKLISEGTQSLGVRVRFLVRFPRERMAELYRAADVFALCSLSEMMPIALIEATASGLPCAVNRHPIFEWMTGLGGVRLDMAEPGELAKSLANLLGDAIMRKWVGAAARDHCLANFSLDAVVDRIVDYFTVIHAI